MANQIYRDRLVSSIEHAIREAQNASRVKHPGTRGRIREIAASEIFSPMLPGGFEIGTGKICDREGHQSPETDPIIYNRTILPPILYSERDGIFPVEACFYSIEIKDAIRKGQEILGLNYEIPEPDLAPGIEVVSKPVLLSLFGFNSDLTNSGITEIERYAKYDPNWNINPVLRVICVVGKGYWYFRFAVSCWVIHPTTEAHDEVVDFVGGISNSLATKLDVRKGQQLGGYLIKQRPTQVVRQTMT
jgi:hypothetical protein